MSLFRKKNDLEESQVEESITDETQNEKLVDINEDIEEGVKEDVKEDVNEEIEEDIEDSENNNESKEEKTTSCKILILFELIKSFKTSPLIFFRENLKLCFIGIVIIILLIYGVFKWLTNTPENRYAKYLREQGRMVKVESGSFMMGSSSDEKATARGVVKEQHASSKFVEEICDSIDAEVYRKVTLTNSFWIGKYEVTQAEYIDIMGDNPSFFKGKDLPVENVSWDDAMKYCSRLTKRERQAGRLPNGYEYTLPTEAQWEYACRAGSVTAFAFGETLCSTQANFDGEKSYNLKKVGKKLGKTSIKGSYTANYWEIYDMHGNVAEWCRDWYEESLPKVNSVNPEGPISGSSRVVKGGDWRMPGAFCRSSYRIYAKAGEANNGLGFRVVLIKK